MLIALGGEMVMKSKLITIFTFVFTISCVTAQTPKKMVDPPLPKQLAEMARVPGELSSDDAIKLSSAISAGKDVEAVITTGGNGCVSMGDTSFVMTESGADVFVYDMTSATRPGTMCTMIYRHFEHKVMLRFEKAGPATIRVWVKQGDKPAVIEKKIVVK